MQTTPRQGLPEVPRFGGSPASSSGLFGDQRRELAPERVGADDLVDNVVATAGSDRRPRRQRPESVVQARAHAFVTGTVDEGCETLRACILHPGTTAADLNTLITDSSPNSSATEQVSPPPRKRWTSGRGRAAPRAPRSDDGRRAVGRNDQDSAPLSPSGDSRPDGRFWPGAAASAPWMHTFRESKAGPHRETRGRPARRHQQGTASSPGATAIGNAAVARFGTGPASTAAPAGLGWSTSSSAGPDTSNPAPGVQLCFKWESSLSGNTYCSRSSCRCPTRCGKPPPASDARGRFLPGFSPKPAVHLVLEVNPQQPTRKENHQCPH